MGGLPGQDQHPPTLWPIQSGNCPLWGRKNPTRREPADKTVAAGTAVIPAKAGTQRLRAVEIKALGPRFRGDDGNYSLAHFLDIHHAPVPDLEVHLLVVEVILSALADRGPATVLKLHDPVRLAAGLADTGAGTVRSEEHTSELQSLMLSSYFVFCIT